MICSPKHDPSGCFRHLCNALREIPPGPINNDEATKIRSLLEDCWQQINGANQAAMAAGKLRRAERLLWNPPFLSFIMERHRKLVFGSTRGELQNWTVDVGSRTAEYTEVGRRQVLPMAPRLNVKKIAAGVCEVVQQGPRSNSDLVKNGTVSWNGDREVRIRQGALIPDIGYKQTVAGRRARFRRALTDMMAALGWQLFSKQRSMKFRRP